MKRLLLLSSCMLVLAGCLKTRAELEAEGGGEMQKQTAAQQRAERIARAEAQTPAKAAPVTIAARFEEYDEQLRKMNGRVEELENGLSQLAAAKQGDAAEKAKEKQLHEARLLAFEDALKKMETQLTAMGEELQKMKAPPPAPLPAVSSGGKGKTSSYDEGEAFFNAKRWKDAIDSYQKYRDTNPKGKMYADATYKIGASFQELGMKDEAKLFFEEVKDKFPGSKEAKKAAVRLKSGK